MGRRLAGKGREVGSEVLQNSDLSGLGRCLTCRQGAQSKCLYTRRQVRNSSPSSLRLNTYSNPSLQGCQMYIVWVEVEAIHNGGVTEWRKRGTGLPGTEAEAGLHYRVRVGQCSGGNTKWE
jgi:hypothetical protein